MTPHVSAANRIRNAGFDTDISGWDASGNCVPPTWDGFGPGNADGAIAVNCAASTVPSSAVEKIRQCVAISAANVDFSAQVTDNGVTGPAAFGLSAFASGDCTGSASTLLDPSGTSTVPAPECCGITWTTFSRSRLPLPEGTGSVLVEIDVVPPADIALDNVELAASVDLGGYLSGNWFNPDQSGHGFQLEFTTSGDLVAIWFVYKPDGSGQTWIYAQGAYDSTKNVVTIPAEILDGAKFPPNFDPHDVGPQGGALWGTLTFAFSDCDHATVSWHSDVVGYDRQNDVPLALSRATRIAGTSCPP